MVKIELDIEGISWYIETTLETDTVPAVGDIIIVDKDCISERDSAELWKTPSNQVFKWADEEDDAPVMVWFDCETEMLVTKRTWKYDIEEEETVCILGVKFIHYEDLYVIVKTCSDSLFSIGQKNCQLFVAKLRNFLDSHNRMVLY